MVGISPSRQFVGQARLVRLLLWKIGDSTDINHCLALARESNMIDADDEEFLRECLNMEEESRPNGADSLDVSSDTVKRLRRCADKLNRADSA